MKDLLLLGIFNSLYFVIGVFALGFIFSKIEEKNAYYLGSGAGMKGLIATGVIGVPVHELSHYIACRVFMHNVERVELFRPKKGLRDGVMGKVIHSREKGNVYQMVGDFFIGVAPVITGSFLLYILMTLYLGSEANIFKMIIDIEGSMEMIKNMDFIKYMFHMLTSGIDITFLIIKSPELFTIKGIIIMFMIYSIAIHLSLSKRDISNSSNAVIVVIPVIIILHVVLGFLGFDFAGLFMKMVTYLFTIMTAGIMISVPLTLFSFAIYVVGGFL